MSGRNVEPEGSHLSLSVYATSISESETLGRMYRALADFVEMGEACVDIVPRGIEFESASDLVDVTQQVFFDAASEPEFSSLFDESFRAVQVAVRTDKFGPVVTRYERAVDSDRHPVCIYMNDGDLGIPPWLWSSSQRRSATRLYESARELFRDACEDINPLYGQLAIEETLPTPSEILGGQHIVGDGLYLSNLLTGIEPNFLAQLQARYGSEVVAAWDSGYYVDGQVEFGSTGVNFENSADFRKQVGGFLLGRLRGFFV